MAWPGVRLWRVCMVGIGVVYRRCVACVGVVYGVGVGTVYGAMALGVRCAGVGHVSCGVRVCTLCMCMSIH